MVLRGFTPSFRLAVPANDLIRDDKGDAGVVQDIDSVENRKSAVNAR